MPSSSFSALQSSFASPSSNREATQLKSFEAQLWDQRSGRRDLPFHCLLLQPYQVTSPVLTSSSLKMF